MTKLWRAKKVKWIRYTVVRIHCWHCCKVFPVQ